ncbi:NAD(P)-binding protein [Athelia psychrophila]|uniref:NAD(P)-binding protein n=1 Tax=Athelia psychrophila TaxID=1759441 RepID=A0A166GVW4_9AGAM|nr:NAD(P)-binding protein [Fibularhizoctonia sp. CBS 109695]
MYGDECIYQALRQEIQTAVSQNIIADPPKASAACMIPLTAWIHLIPLRYQVGQLDNQTQVDPHTVNMVAFLAFLRRQLFTYLPVPTESYTGKTVIVTGSNIGLGKEAAKRYARLGAETVIIAVRSIEKGEAARSEIIRDTGCKDSTVQVWQLDLGSFESVQQFGARVNKELPRLDVLLENAGIATRGFRLAEGYESTITVNVISTFLLFFLCLPKLKDTAQKHNIRPTATIVSSETHTFCPDLPEADPADGKILEALSDPHRANMATRYPTSKLLEVFCVRAFAELHPADKYPITVNTICPGLCHSELAREAGWGLYIMKLLLARGTEAGSRGLVYATQYGPESHGKWVYDNTIHAPGKYVTTPEGQKVEKRLWNELVEALEKISPGVTQN